MPGCREGKYCKHKYLKFKLHFLLGDSAVRLPVWAGGFKKDESIVPPA